MRLLKRDCGIVSKAGPSTSVLYAQAILYLLFCCFFNKIIMTKTSYGAVYFSSGSRIQGDRSSSWQEEYGDRSKKLKDHNFNF